MAKNDHEIELFQKLLDANEEERERIIDETETEVETIDRMMNVVEHEVQNKQRQEALYFESLKGDIVERYKNNLRNVKGEKEEFSDEVADCARDLMLVQLISTLLREDPKWEDISKRLDKLGDYIGKDNNKDDGQSIGSLEELEIEDIN